MALLLKPGVGQYIAIHTTITVMDSSLLISTLSVHSPAFFQKPLLRCFFFSLSAVANTEFLSRPAE